MSFFNFGTKSKLGIDIGTASIKIVEVENASRLKLKNYGLFELKSEDETIDVSSRGLIARANRLSDEDIVWGIKQTIKRAGIHSKDVIASIQSFATFSTVLTLPYLSEAEIAKAIPFEAKKYIPLPLSEVNIDWSIIDVAPTLAESATNQASKTPMVEVFLVAVPKEEASKYQNIIRQAGLNLRALELENTALIRSIIGNDMSPAVIVNIGGRSTTVLIVDKGVERQSHNYEVGGFEISKSISRALNISISRAEELKRSFGLKKVDSNTIRQVMSSLVDLIVFETRKTVHHYEDLRGIKINKIFLVGGLTNMPGFYEYFKEKLQMEVVIGNASSRIIIPPELEPVRPELNTTFSVALGLAMRKL